MDWRERIVIDPAVLVGKPVIRGTRIAVEFVIDLLGRGWTPEQIVREFDHLAAEDVQACLAYAGEVLKSERTRSGRGTEAPPAGRDQAARPKVTARAGDASTNVVRTSRRSRPCS